MLNHKIVTRDEWLDARQKHLAKEKEFTRLRDQLSQERRELPWVKVDREYIFNGPNGKENLSELFEDKPQLLVYHFMFDPAWDEGCPMCSYFADSYSGAIVHLKQRGVTMVTVSKAPLDKLERFKERMGWRFKWVSSYDNDFNLDYHVSFTADEKEKGEVYYNYGTSAYFESEGPGISAFLKDADGNIFHTYSSYARGLDMLIGAYNLLDLVPKGRDEADLPWPMAWIRHHDKYGD